MKICKNIISDEPKLCKTKLNLTKNPEEIPNLIPAKKLNLIQKNDENPYYAVQEIIDIEKPANRVIFSPEFWESYFKVMKKIPIPGSKKGHTYFGMETPENDFYLIGAKIEDNKVYLKNYIPPEGDKSSNKRFIQDVKLGLIHFSIVSWTEDVIELDENGMIKKITAVRSVKGERNDAVQVGMGAMDQKVNIDLLQEEGIKYNPYPNYHAARIRKPGEFARIVVLKTLDNGILIKGGPLKSDPGGSSKNQAYWLPKKKFTVAQAKKWLKDHNIKYISFEPATKGNNKMEELIMDDNILQDIIKNLNNQIENGTVTKKVLAKNLGIQIITEKHTNAIDALEKITKIVGEKPVEKIQEMKKNAEAVKLQAYENTREKLMTEAFGPEISKINGEDKTNLKRQAAEAYVKNEIQTEDELKAEIKTAKENPVVLTFSFQDADVNSDTNIIKQPGKINSELNNSEHEEI